VLLVLWTTAEKWNSNRASGISSTVLLQASIKEDGYCYIHITSSASANKKMILDVIRPEQQQCRVYLARKSYSIGL
jgi:hypothetical protein